MENQEQVIQKDLLDKCYKKIGVYEIMVQSQKEFMDKQESLINDMKEANHGMNREIIKRGLAMEILGNSLDEYEALFNVYHTQFTN
jgi:glycerol dehydrogenase-like iron-containing ADH family enzyme